MPEREQVLSKVDKCQHRNTVHSHDMSEELNSMMFCGLLSDLEGYLVRVSVTSVLMLMTISDQVVLKVGLSSDNDPTRLKRGKSASAEEWTQDQSCPRDPRCECVRFGLRDQHSSEFMTSSPLHQSTFKHNLPDRPPTCNHTSCN